MSEKEIGTWPHERKCPECKKMFCAPVIEDWRYKYKGVLLCSWGCVRKREEEERQNEEKAREKRRKKLTPAQKTALVRRCVFRGMSNEEISEETGISSQLVNYYRKKIEAEYE